MARFACCRFGGFRDFVRLCTVFRFGVVAGRVRSVRIDVVRLVFCSCSVRLSIHFYHVAAFVGSILVLLLLFFGDLIWIGTVCGDLGRLS